MATRIGVDLSRWQGVTPMAELPPAGIAFLYEKATHGLGPLDPVFVQNWRASAGVFERGRGAYHWLTAEDPIAQAERFTRALEAAGGLGDLYPAIDFEEPSIALRAEPLLRHLLACCRRVRELAGGVVVYSGRFYVDERLGAPDACSPALVEELAAIPYWHAEYPRLVMKDRRACGLAPPTIPPPTLPELYRSRGIECVIEQFDGDHGCVLPSGVDADFDIATDEALERITFRSSNAKTDPAPPDAGAATPLRAGEGEHAIEEDPS